METLMYVAIGLSTANSVILIGLIYLYAKIAAKARASYSIGLAVFAGLLLMHNLLTVFAYTSMAPFFGAGALPYLSGIGALELAGLIVLMRMTV